MFCSCSVLPCSVLFYSLLLVSVLLFYFSFCFFLFCFALFCFVLCLCFLFCSVPLHVRLLHLLLSCSVLAWSALSCHFVGRSQVGEHDLVAECRYPHFTGLTSVEIRLRPIEKASLLEGCREQLRASYCYQSQL